MFIDRKTFVLATAIASASLVPPGLAEDPNKIYPRHLYERHATLINKEILIPESSMLLEGTCGRAGLCEIAINGTNILTSNGISINTDNIIGWTLTNATNKGGVLFLSKNEDYRFLIKHFGGSGDRKISEIGFFNFKTAQTFLSTLELLSGLGVNHDQAGATTKCLAYGKDAMSGSAIYEKDTGLFAGSGLRNTTTGALVGGGTGALVGDLVGSSASIATGGVVGGVAGALVGSSLGGSPGSLSLKRNVVSDIRATPALSKPFLDGSFQHRSDCVDDYRNSTNVNIKSPVPLKISE